MRQLKHHEQKLLKKVNFLRWKNEHNLRELQVSRAETAGSCQAAHSITTAVQHWQWQWRWQQQPAGKVKKPVYSCNSVIVAQLCA
jgi:hypothetical protein